MHIWTVKTVKNSHQTPHTMANIHLTRTVESVDGKKYQVTTAWSPSPRSIRGQSAPIVTTIYSGDQLIYTIKSYFKDHVIQKDLENEQIITIKDVFPSY